ncbi:hypothetical protein [Schumannella soli]|uniref:DUF8094 domain-containing protein n=1 Tax=Schumannella soli TaxID=2590779 RepID=A0A506Y0A4_9MICO|nr:hypothetical protein [Schumannella soli]TPW75455.1 hypothetical protein FJ657_06045 [Schumannella soli]
MRFVLAIVLFVCALASAGYGIAQRTVLAGPDQLTVKAEVRSDAPITIISGKTLSSVGGAQQLTVGGSGEVNLAYGRTADVMAWVGDSSYNTVSYNAEKGALTGKTVDGSDSDAIPSAVGSDLWLDEKRGESSVAWPLKLSSDYSVIVTGAKDAAAPADVSIRWPLDNSAPYSGLLILIGIALLIAGLLAFIWALVHARRRRGPRRKQPKLPRAPRPKAITARSSRALPAGPSAPRGGRRRGFVVIPALLVGALALTGCTTLNGLTGAGGGSAASPSPSASASGAAATKPVAVLPAQLDKIVARVSTSVGRADAALDADLASDRLTGPALTTRTASYKIRKADANQTAEPSIPAASVEVDLPQQNASWPRTVFAVVVDPKQPTVAPMSLMLVQESARSQYKAEYVIPLEAKAKVPDLAPADLGASRVKPDVKYLKIEPSKLVDAYAGILLQDTAAPDYDFFDADGDALRTALGASYKAQRKASLPASATIDFTHAQGPGETIVFGTNDSGAIVTVDLNDIETVKPAEQGAAINPDGRVKLLSGISQTTKGIQSTYDVQLLFYVPLASDTDPQAKIKLLGFSQVLSDAKELP